MAPQDGCAACPHHEAVSYRLGHQAECLEAHGEKLDKVDVAIEKLTIIVANQAEEAERHRGEYERLRGDVDDMRQRPARQWGAVQNAALTVAVTALVNVFVQAALHGAPLG